MQNLFVLKVTWKINFWQLFISLRLLSTKYTECKAFSPVVWIVSPPPPPHPQASVAPSPFWVRGGGRRGGGRRFGQRDRHSGTISIEQSLYAPSPPGFCRECGQAILQVLNLGIYRKCPAVSGLHSLTHPSPPPQNGSAKLETMPQNTTWNVQETIRNALDSFFLYGKMSEKNPQLSLWA